MSEKSYCGVVEHSLLKSGEFGGKPELLVLPAAVFRLDANRAQTDLLSSSPFDKTWGVEVQRKTRFVESCTRDFVTIPNQL